MNAMIDEEYDDKENNKDEEGKAVGEKDDDRKEDTSEPSLFPQAHWRINRTRDDREGKTTPTYQVVHPLLLISCH